MTMIKCRVCQTENLEDSRYCDECGTVLNGTGESSSGPSAHSMEFKVTDDFPAFRSQIKTMDAPLAERSSSKLATGDDSETRGDSNGLASAKLEIERGGTAGTLFDLSQTESQIGRWDADNGIFPDVDLDAHDPEAKVSRRHARIFVENGRHFIEDLGSTNGTFINRGRRLIPGDKHPLSDNDEIIVGKTFLRFRIL